MKKVMELNTIVGRLEIFEDFKKRVFLARPEGVLNPSLVKEDLHRARKFANEVNATWSYITNTEGIIFSNPLNLLYLKEVKKIKNLKQIVIFAPNPINRALLKLTSFLICPDRVIGDREEFEQFMATV